LYVLTTTISRDFRPNTSSKLQPAANHNNEAYPYSLCRPSRCHSNGCKSSSSHNTTYLESFQAHILIHYFPDRKTNRWRSKLCMPARPSPHEPRLRKGRLQRLQSPWRSWSSEVPQSSWRCRRWISQFLVHSLLAWKEGRDVLSFGGTEFWAFG
jgi:hypothetical protein